MEDYYKNWHAFSTCMACHIVPGLLLHYGTSYLGPPQFSYLPQLVLILEDSGISFSRKSSDTPEDEGAGLHAYLSHQPDHILLDYFFPCGTVTSMKAVTRFTHQCSSRTKPLVVQVNT